MIENRNEMIYKHDDKVKNISECNLGHYVINPPKRANNINNHCSPILHGCISIRKSKAKFMNFQILLGSGFCSTIIMIMLVENLRLEKDAVMQWHTQAGNITTSIEVKIYFTLPALSATCVVTWNCHMDDSAKGRYDMILGIYLLTELGLNLEFSEHVIEEDDGPFKGSTAPMVDLSKYIYIILNIECFVIQALPNET